MATSPCLFSFLLSSCDTSVSDSLSIHACLAPYLVAPWSKKLVSVLVAHLPPPWVVLAAVFLLWCLYSSEVFVFLARLSMLTKAGRLLPVFFHIATHLQAFGEKLGKKQKNRSRVEKQEGRETQMICPQIWVATFSSEVYVRVSVSSAPLT